MTASTRTKSDLLAAGLTALALCVAPGTSAQAADGTWELAWGKNVSIAGGTGFLERCVVATDCQAGGNATAFGGELDYPDGIAVDATGNVYVADSSNDRVQKFDSDGNFLRAWGKNVSIGGVSSGPEICTSALDCREGGTGGAGGEFRGPEGIAVDPAGNVYVVDSSNHRIQKFDTSGNFLRAWGSDVSISDVSGGHEVCTAVADCQAGTADQQGGELNSPSGIAASATAVFVAEDSGDRVQRFDADGNFVLAFGNDVIAGGPWPQYEVCAVEASCQDGDGAGIGGAVDDPSGAALDPSGNLVVADSSGDRLQRYDSAGNFQLAWGKDVVSAGPGNTGTGFEICVGGTDTCKQGSSTTALGGELDNPEGVAIDGAGNIYVSDSSSDRVQRFSPALAFHSAWGKDVVTGGLAVYEVCTNAAACKAGADTFPPPPTAFGGELFVPSGIAADAAGSVYVSDSFQHRIQKFAGPSPAPPAATPGPAVTGRRAAALAKCKRKRSKEARKKCVKKAKKLPV